jgi:hypothetical protein
VNIALCILIGFVLGLLAALPGFMLVLRRFTRLKVEELNELKRIHSQQFQDLIGRMNHEGMIPNAASALGLMNLILWAISNSISGLEKLYENKDWNTKEVITDLRGIALLELMLLHKKLGDFLEAKRNVLRDFHDTE